MIILVDQDGVLANFDDYFTTKWEEMFPNLVLPPINKRETFYIDDYVGPNLKDQVWHIAREEGFFENLPVIEGSIEGLNKLKDLGHEVYICTSPLKYYENCVKEKYSWVEKNFGYDWTQRLILTRDKTVIKGDILIDDKPEIAGAYTPVWEHIIFDQTYNKNIKDKRRMTWKMTDQVKDLF